MTGFVKGIFGGVSHLLDRGFTGTAVDYMLESVGKTSEKLSKPVFEWIVKQVTDANGILDLSTGEVKSGATKIVEGLLNELGQILSSKKIPRVVSVFGSDSNCKVYLSHKLALETRNSFEMTGRKLAEVPDKLGDYRQASSMFVRVFSSELKNYIDLFDVFVKDRVFIFFKRRPPSYEKLLYIRKKMKTSIVNMKKYLETYDKDKYTFEAIKNRLSKEELGVYISSNARKELAEVLAFNIFQGACQICEKYADDVANWWATANTNVPRGKNADEVFYDTVYTKSSLGDKLKKELKNALQLTHGLVERSGDTYNGEIYKTIAGESLENIKKNYGDRIKGCFGWKACLVEAEELVKKYDDKKHVDVQGMEIGSPLMGDYAKQMLDCVNYTLKELNNVIYLGNKLNKDKHNKGIIQMQYEDTKKFLAIDFERLIGYEYKSYSAELKRMEKHQSKLKEKSSRNAIRRAYSLFDKCRKLYDKVNKKSKEIVDLGYKDFPKEVRLQSLRVDVSDPAEKNYDLERKYKDLEEIRKKVQTEGNVNKDWALLLQRKSTKFIFVCNKWINNLSKFKEEQKQKSKDENRTIKTLLSDVKNSYKKLSREKRNEYEEEYKRILLDLSHITPKNSKSVKEDAQRFVETCQQSE